MILVYKGADSQRSYISEMKNDNMAEMEQLVAWFECERTQSRHQSVLEADAEKSFDDF